MPNNRRNRKRGTSVRLSDVARRAGVSTASVSRAINEPDKVTQRVRERVLKAASELNWVPHAAAQALASLKTRTIGAITATLGHSNIAEELEALQSQLTDAGYVLLLACSGLDEQTELDQARRMIQRGIDALILHHSESHSPELWDLLQAQQVPTIITRASVDVPGFVNIGYSSYKAFHKLTSHLLSLGHKSFGLMMITSEQNEQTQTLEPDSRVQSAYAGVMDALNEAGIRIRQEHITNTYFSMTKGRECFRKIMSATERPTALICMNDYLAIGSLLEALEMDIRVPEDLSVVGFDDVELASLVPPPLTTMRTPDHGMGALTAQCILEILQGGSTQPYRRELEVEFVLRDSTAAPANFRHAK